MREYHQRRIDSAVANCNVDCGDNSCRYAPASARGGMRTNGGCRCSSNEGRKVEFYLRQQLHTAMKIIEELENEQ